jgi:hypothetical protein
VRFAQDIPALAAQRPLDAGDLERICRASMAA